MSQDVQAIDLYVRATRDLPQQLHDVMFGPSSVHPGDTEPAVLSGVDAFGEPRLNGPSAGRIARVRLGGRDVPVPVALGDAQLALVEVHVGPAAAAGYGWQTSRAPVSVISRCAY